MVKASQKTKMLKESERTQEGLKLKSYVVKGTGWGGSFVLVRSSCRGGGVSTECREYFAEYSIG